MGMVLCPVPRTLAAGGHKPLTIRSHAIPVEGLLQGSIHLLCRRVEQLMDTPKHSPTLRNSRYFSPSLLSTHKQRVPHNSEELRCMLDTPNLPLLSRRLTREQVGGQREFHCHITILALLNCLQASGAVPEPTGDALQAQAR